MEWHYSRHKGKTQRTRTGHRKLVCCRWSIQFIFTRKPEEKYELEYWPRKGGRLKAVVNTVRSFRRDKLPAAENTPAHKEAEMKSEKEAKNKTRSASLIRKEFAFFKDRRQRSVSKSQFGVMYKSRDDMDLTRENDAAIKRNRNGSKKLVR